MLYVVSLEPDDGYEQQFNRWYDTEHIPELMACPGFLSARRYEVVEDVVAAPRYLATYEVTGLETFQSPEYLALRGRGPDQLSALSREAAHRRQNLIGKYREILRAPD
jgi:hypothetical protein